MAKPKSNLILFHIVHMMTRELKAEWVVDRDYFVANAVKTKDFDDNFKKALTTSHGSLKRTILEKITVENKEGRFYVTFTPNYAALAISWCQDPQMYAPAKNIPMTPIQFTEILIEAWKVAQEPSWGVLGPWWRPYFLSLTLRVKFMVESRLVELYKEDMPEILVLYNKAAKLTRGD